MTTPVTKENPLVTPTVTNEDLLSKRDSMHTSILDTRVKKEVRDAPTQSSVARRGCLSRFFCPCLPYRKNTNTNPELETKYQELNKKLDQLRNDICDTEKINKIQTYLLTEPVTKTDYEYLLSNKKPKIDNVLKRIVDLYLEIIDIPIEIEAYKENINEIKQHVRTKKAQQWSTYKDSALCGYIPHRHDEFSCVPNNELTRYMSSQDLIHDLHEFIRRRIQLYDDATKITITKLMEKLECTATLHYSLVTIAWVKLRENTCTDYSSLGLINITKLLRTAAEKLGTKITKTLASDNAGYADDIDQLHNLSSLLMSLSLLMLPYAIYTKKDEDENKSTYELEHVLTRSGYQDANYHFHDLFPETNLLKPERHRIWTLKDINNDENSSITKLFNHLLETNSELQKAFKKYLEIEENEQKRASLKIHHPFI